MTIKRNPFARLLSVVMLLSLCCLFTACPSDSDDKDNVSQSELSSILRKNKWVNRDYNFDAGGAYAELTQDVDYYYFISETEGILCHYYKWIDTSGIDDHGREESYFFFTYSISGNSVSLRMEDGSTQSFVYDGQYLKKGNYYYAPVTPSAGDWEQIDIIKEKHKYEGKYEFEYFIGFDDTWPSVYENGVYSHVIMLGFSVPENTYIRGISEFGIAIYPVNGDISYKKGFKDDVWVEKKYVHGLQSYCYIGTFSDNKEHSFTVTFVLTSTSRTAKFKYAPTFYTAKEGWKDGHNFVDYEYVPKKIMDDENSSSGNNGNNDSGTGTISYTSCPDNNHPHAIDLGLPSGTKWACCNVGASKPEDYGEYYAWGETETKSKYSWDTYKYGRSSKDVDNIGSDIAGTIYDVAHVKWGGNWRMPTLKQIKELRSIKWIWHQQNNIKGTLFTGSNGASLFIPAAGFIDENGSTRKEEKGEYWSSTFDEQYPDAAPYLFFRWGLVTEYTGFWRYYGRSVRPVTTK